MERARKANKRLYSIKGYSDHENMWEKLLNVEKCAICPPTKYPNSRHEYTTCVEGRVFRIKKNPYYSTHLKKTSINNQSTVFGETGRMDNHFKDIGSSRSP